jgi:glycosyltransferase involved in cell wall biosynthesis
MGGIENCIRWLAEAQVAAGHKVSVLVASLDYRASITTLNGVEIHKIPRFGTFASVPLTPTLPLALRRYKPDIAHIHSPYPPGELFAVLWGQAKHLVITHHSDIVKQKTILKGYTPILRWVLSQVDLIMPTSANYIDTSDFLPEYKDKCRVVPLGIQVNRFKPTANLPLAQDLKAKFGENVILFVGQLRYYKGLDTLIEAMSQVSKATLIIAGDGPLRTTLKAQVIRLNLQERIHFAGRVSDEDLPAFFQAANCFVLPSNSKAEAFGIVLLEAMAASLPLISTELGTGTSFVNSHGRTGFVVPPKDPLALAEAINTLIADRSLRQQFAQAALTRVKEEFSQEVMVNNVMRVYDEVLNGP